MEQEIIKMYLKLKQCSMPDNSFDVKKESKLFQRLHIMQMITKLG